MCDRCPICLGEFDGHEPVQTISDRVCRDVVRPSGGCGHRFHKACLDALEMATPPPFRCPACRCRYRNYTEKDQREQLRPVLGRPRTRQFMRERRNSAFKFHLSDGGRWEIKCIDAPVGTRTSWY